MANMSCSRFRNTSLDLKDCLDALDPRHAENKISTTEIEAGIKMFLSFLEYCEIAEIINYFDADRISEVFEEVNAAVDRSRAKTHGRS